MSAELWNRTLRRLLRDESTRRSAIPASLRRSEEYRRLLASEVLQEKRAGRGYEVIVVDTAVLSVYVQQRFPDGATTIDAPTGISNSLRTGDSKSGARTDPRATYFLRGWSPVDIAGESFDLADFTQRLGGVGFSNQRLHCERVCLVENQDVFFRAHELLGQELTYIHPYGRAGEALFQLLEAKHYYHWPDYDFTGLSEFLRFRKTHPSVQLVLPEPLEALWSRARPRKRKDKLEETVRTSTHPEVVRVRELLVRNNTFLEQQVCFADEAILRLPPPQTTQR